VIGRSIAVPVMGRRPLILLGLSVCLPGCRSKTPAKTGDEASPSQLPPYRGPLVPPEEIAADFVWQQRVSAFHGDSKGAFDAVVQKSGLELLVLGLSPFKTRGFALTQRGTSYEYEQFVPFDLPFSPEAVLFDIHRAFFFGLSGPFPDSGTRTSRFEGEAITDTFEHKHLVRRLFSPVSGTREDLVVTYDPPGYAPLTPPAMTKLENRAYEYRLEVETSSIQALE
jgi:hypothetical protein